MQYSDFVALMKSLAKNHKDIAHEQADADLPMGKRNSFFRANGFEELVQSNRTQVDSPLLVVGKSFGKLQTDNQHRVEDNQTFNFQVLKAVSDIMDFDELDTARSECKRIGMALIAEMHRIWIDGGYDDHTLHDFDPNTVRYDEVGPIATDFVGYRFSMTIDDEAYDISSIDLDTEFGRDNN